MIGCWNPQSVWNQHIVLSRKQSPKSAMSHHGTSPSRQNSGHMPSNTFQLLSKKLIGFYSKLFGFKSNFEPDLAIFPKEVSFEVLSPWMRLIDPNTLLDIMQPILKLSKPIPKFLAFISDNMPSTDPSVSKMVKNRVIMSQMRIFFSFIEKLQFISSKKLKISSTSTNPRHISTF